MSKLSKVKFAEIMVKAGANPFTMLNLVGYPRCVGFYIGSQSPNDTYSFGSKPDDDFAISWINRRLAGGENFFEGGNQQRNVTQYDVFYFAYNVNRQLKHGESELQIGETLIRVRTFDGWGSGWQNVPWQITFVYSDNSERAVNGGDSRSGLSSQEAPSPPGDYYTTGPHFYDYKENGEINIPPPVGWKLPDFLEQMANN